MIDPRNTLVLIRDDAKSSWRDRTADVESAESGPSGTTITFKQKPNFPFRYGLTRAAVCYQGRPVPVPPFHRLSVVSELWKEAPLEIVEFAGPEGMLRKIFRVNSKGIERSYLYPAEEVQIIADATKRSVQSRDVLHYFRKIVATKDPKDDPIVGAYRSFDFVHPDSVLVRYLSGSLPEPHETTGLRVLPFQSNLSQQEAIAQALSHTVSTIEGPPGTGKTETILNLIANIVVGNLGSVAIVSFSNAAVANVGEKLTEYGFGHIVAELGNKKKREAFFTGQKVRDQFVPSPAQQSAFAPDPTYMSKLDSHLQRLQMAEREQAKTRALLAEYELEQIHFEQHRDNETSINIDQLPLLRQPLSRILQFLAETALETKHNYSLGVLARIRKFFKYGRMRDIDPEDIETVLALQAIYYRRRIMELRERLNKLDRELDGANFESLRIERRRHSLDIFTSSVAARHREGSDTPYTEDVLKKLKLFRFFEHEYPVILSTCHSLRDNIPEGHLFDYVIIDEASQVDLLSASLAMSVCRNLIVVGDRKQLAQISKVPDHIGPPPHPAYDYGKESILSSIHMLYGDAAPSTLLREHYRCHPTIIGFCNRAFYDGELIPYTSAEGRFEPAMRVQPTTRGNHMRQHRTGGKSNQRELDVVLNEVLPKAPPDIEPNDIALAAPYRQQVDKARVQLSDQIDTVDTVHKLQGRQKRMVALTTVLSETWQGRLGLRFVDDPRLINVAVSRAIDAFVLVTNFEQLPKSRHIQDLIGYIQYQYPTEVIRPSAVVSVFDLLYKDYDAQLAPLAARLSRIAKYRSEEIVRVLLNDILGEQQYAHLHMGSQVFLKNLVPAGTVLDDAQAAFVRRTSSVDFVIYNNVSKTPLLAIEVDGFAWHENNPKQLRRDDLKDSILATIELPLLRLRTTESNEEARIRESLAALES